LHEDIKNNSKKVLKDVYSFLGVNDTYVPEQSGIVNKTVASKFNLATQVGGYVARILNSLKLGKAVGFLYKLNLRFNRKEFSYPPISKSMREELKQYFYKDNQDLLNLTNRKEVQEWM
jgi:hypothetical protein